MGSKDHRLLDLIRKLEAESYLSLTTFRKTGKPVATPVWFAVRPTGLCVWTRADSGKVKRLRNKAQVQVAPCTARGRETGPRLNAQVRFLDADQEKSASLALSEKYGLQYRIGRFFSRMLGRQTLFLEIYTNAPHQD